MMILLISACIGMSIILLIWQVVFVYESIPTEDRAWRDKPLLAFRLVWPFIQVFDHYGSRFYSVQRHEAAATRLRQAGLEFTLSSGQLIAARLVGALALLIFCEIIWSRNCSALIGKVFPKKYQKPIACLSRIARGSCIGQFHVQI